MARRLILVRHAKSSWDDPRLPDKERVLNDRGRSAARRMGAWLRENGHFPGQVMCSSAVRTRQTWDLISAGVGGSPRVDFLDALFHAGEDTLLRCLAKAAADVVLLVGHNPGIGEFAEHFATKAPDHPDFMRYPTCATTIYEIAAPNWATVKFGQNPVLDFVTPRDLAARPDLNGRGSG